MEKSIILKLVFDGDVYGDNISMFDIKEYKDNSDAFDKIIETLCKDLSEEEKYNVLWDIATAQGGMESAVVDRYFKEGFKLGLSLGAQNFLD